MWDKLWYNATLVDAHGQALTHHAIAVTGKKISWVGPDLAANLDNARECVDCNNALITPGLIDCHTHLIYAGNRSGEFEQRLLGVSYEEIAKQGGGIKSTVKMTRQASEQELFDLSFPRLKSLIEEGVTTVEIKSGYGLTKDCELKMLKVAKALEEASGIVIKKTFLGAHAIPDEMTADWYIDYLCQEVLPEAFEQRLVDAVDIFCESIAFNSKQTEKMLKAAVDLGLPIKCHAEQLSDLGASGLAAKMGALSCEHLEYVSDESLKLMAANNTIAVLLPGAFYFLKEKTKPPIDKMRQMGLDMAIATDSNPGSSPTTSLLLMMNMACTLFGLTVTEAYQAVTLNAARALGIENEWGQLKPEFRANFIVWPFSDLSELCYGFGVRHNKKIIVDGKSYGY